MNDDPKMPFHTRAFDFLYVDAFQLISHSLRSYVCDPGKFMHIEMRVVRDEMENYIKRHILVIVLKASNKLFTKQQSKKFLRLTNLYTKNEYLCRKIFLLPSFTDNLFISSISKSMSFKEEK